MTRPSRAPVAAGRRVPPGQGRVLQRAPAAAAPQPAPRQGTYIVKRGDTLYSIALEVGVDHRELGQWNRLDDAARLRVGQELRITAPDDRSAVQVGSALRSGELEARPLGPAAGASPGAPAPAAAPDGGLRTSPKAL